MSNYFPELSTLFPKTVVNLFSSSMIASINKTHLEIISSYKKKSKHCNDLILSRDLLVGVNYTQNLT